MALHDMSIAADYLDSSFVFPTIYTATAINCAVNHLHNYFPSANFGVC